MRFDYHMHTPLCQHAKGSPVDYAKAAKASGLKEIGFSDHCPMPTQYDDWRMAPHEFPDYLDLVEEARQAVPELNIRLGLEADYIAGFENHIRELRKQAAFDYFIGSVHYISPDWDLDNPTKLEKWKDQPYEVSWKQYYRCITESAQSGLFDIIGHPDLCKKFCHIPPGDLTPYYLPALEAIADNKLCIEINTSGRHKPIEEAYPSVRFLELAFERDIPIVISSDAHNPEEVGRDFDWAKQFAWDVGYRFVQQFREGKRLPVPLSEF
ncbi:MAG: histidinol-phosphatase HisJ family protein [Verrucomicrobiae bacterium]|nr:histidinol-phosphatase HisJ family protein [Verrucomicrobiae bacterium]